MLAPLCSTCKVSFTWATVFWFVWLTATAEMQPEMSKAPFSPTGWTSGRQERFVRRSTTAAKCGGFAAERRDACSRYPSMAAGTRAQAANAGSHGRPHIGANGVGVSWPPRRKNWWKIKKRKHARKTSFLCSCYILRAIRAGRCRERRYADNIFIQIYFRMHHFVVKFSKFSSPQAARGQWPP